MKLFSYHEKQERKKTARLPLSAYLSYLLVATLMFTGVSFSKFASTASGSDSARVAYVVAAATGEGDKNGAINAADDNSAFDYKVTVSNFEDQNRPSEVVMSYTIYIDLPANCPALKFSVLDEAGDVLDTKVSTQMEKGQTIALYNSTSMYLPAGVATTKEHTVKITGTEDTAGNHTGIEIKIHVKAEQID